MEVVRAKDRPEISKRPMEVFCRVRGGLNELDEVGMKVSSETDLIVRKPESSMSVKYKFKKIFDSDSSQKFVFDSVAFQLVQELLTGKNGLLFAYGVTGSGKTYTMNGTKDEPGIMPRSVDVLFNTISPYLAEKYVFKPDKMNRFEIQSESDAKFERERDELKLKAQKEESTEKMQKCSSEEDLLRRSKDSSRAPYVDEDNLYSVFVTYVEVYNNNVYDLLEDLYSDLNKPKPLQTKLVREDSTHCMYAHGVTEVEVRTPDEAFLIFHKGQKRKHVAHTVLNNESSRAHTVFTIRVVQAPLDEKGEKLVQDKNLVMVSQLSLVDLAGSERSLRTNNSGQRLREAGNINNSLMTLRTCLECLRDNQKGGNKLIPYRASRLTHLFKHFFEGDGQVSMIVCVNPGLKDLDETLHVLRFAEMSQEIHMTHSAQRPNTLHSVFTPGRRRANRIAKVIDYDAIEKDPLPEEKEVNEKGGGESTSTSDSGIRTPLDVFNRFPVVDYVECDDEITLKNSINYWTNSLPSWNNLTNILNKRAADGREKIVKNERDFFLVNQEVKNWKSMYESEKKKVEELEGKLQSLNNDNYSLKRKLNECEMREKRLKREITDKNIELQRLKIDNNAVQEKMKAKMQEVEDKLKKEMDKKLDKQKLKMKHELKRKDKKLKEVQRIVAGGLIPGSKTPSINSLLSEGEASSGNKPSEVDSSENPSSPRKTTSDLVPSSPLKAVSDPPVSPPSTPRDVALASPLHRSGIMRKIATANKRHRRSRSADIWLDHRPAIAVPLGTVMQPVMEKRKSVTRLTQAKDITEKTSKYCLMTQSQDSDGDLETRLYKGDVIPTSGGGAQVMFNDIEILKQVSPRKSPMSPRK